MAEDRKLRKEYTHKNKWKGERVHRNTEGPMGMYMPLTDTFVTENGA